MNDRYLFRAKRIDNGEWVEGYLFDDGFENGRMFVGGLVIEEYHGTACDDWSITGINFYEVDPSTICQCTGLKDKNGKLIWENDIVEIGEHECMVNGLYKVIYCEINFCYALERSVDYHYNFFTFSALNGFETSSNVIGNIFDNPELINE